MECAFPLPYVRYLPYVAVVETLLSVFLLLQYHKIHMLYETKMNHPPHRFVDNVDAPQPTEPATSATREYAPCSDGADSRHGGEAPPTAEQRTPIHPHKHSPFLNNHQPHRRNRCRPRIARRRWMKRWITIYSYLYFFDIILFLILIYYLVKFRAAGGRNSKQTTAAPSPPLTSAEPIARRNARRRRWINFFILICILIF